jgi:4-amino-4-deoxy-L-arabinose transferase-like glycosyltransferase
MKKILNLKPALILIILLASFLRFYQLGNIPSGLTNDEAGVGYDAYSVLQTGKDQWNQFLPLRFVAFGDYPAPILRYLAIPFVSLFDLNSFSVRFPSALFGVLSVILIFLVTKRLFNYRAALFSSMLMAISPWAIGLSRVTIEPNIAITIFLSGLLFYFLAKDNKKILLICALLFSITIYTYSAYVLFLPLAAIVLAIWDKKYILSNIKLFIISFLLFILLISPNFITKSTTASVRFLQVGILNNIDSIGLIGRLNNERGFCIEKYDSTFCRVVNNKGIMFSSIFVKNYFSHFSTNFLYNVGTTTQYSILPERGLEYFLEFILLIFGVVVIVKNKYKNGYLLLFLFLVSPIPDSLTGSGHYGRSSIMLPFLLMIEGLGFAYLVDIFSKIKNMFLKKSLYMFAVLIIFAGTLFFWVNYQTYFKNYYSISSQYGYEDLMKKVNHIRNSYDKIYISKHLNDTKQYIYYLFYNKYDPVKYQNKYNISFSRNSDGWFSVDRIDNIYFVNEVPIVNKSSKLSKEKILIISHPVDFPRTMKPVLEIKDKIESTLFEGYLLNDLIKYYQENEYPI